MDEEKHLLPELVTLVRAYRKAEKENAAYKGDPREDPIKKDYLSEVQRRRQDLDGFMKKMDKIYPDPDQPQTVLF